MADFVNGEWTVEDPTEAWMARANEPGYSMYDDPRYLPFGNIENVFGEERGEPVGPVGVLPGSVVPGGYTLDQQQRVFERLPLPDQLAVLAKSRREYMLLEGERAEVDAIEYGWKKALGTIPETEDRVKFFTDKYPGLPSDYIRNNLKELEYRMMIGDTKALVNDHKAFADLLKNPEYQARVQGQVPAWTAMSSLLAGRYDSTLEKAGRTIASWPQQLQAAGQGVAGMYATAAEWIVGDEDYYDLIRESLVEQNVETQRAMYAPDMTNAGAVESTVVMMAGAVPSVALSAASSLVGAPHVGVALAGVQSGGATNINLLSQGVEPTDAFFASMAVGAANAYIEKIQLDALVPTKLTANTIRGAATRRLLTQTVEGGFQEGSQSFISSFGENMALGKKMYDDGEITGLEVFSNAINETGNDLDSIVAEAGVGALVSLIVGAPNVMRGLVAHRRAVSRQERLQKAADIVSSENLTSRPNTFKETVDALTDEKGVVVPVKALDALAQGDPGEYADLLRLLNLDPEDVDVARASLVPLVNIDMATWLDPETQTNAAVDALRGAVSYEGSPSINDTRAELENSGRIVGEFFDALAGVTTVDAQNVEAVDMAYANLEAAFRGTGIGAEAAKASVLLLREGQANLARASGEPLAEYLKRANLVVEGDDVALMFGSDVVSVPADYLGDVDAAQAADTANAIQARIDALDVEMQKALDAIEEGADSAEFDSRITEMEQQRAELQTQYDETSVNAVRMLLDPERMKSRKNAIAKRAGELVVGRLMGLATVESAVYDEATNTTQIEFRNAVGDIVRADIAPQGTESDVLTLPITESGNVNIAPLAALVKPMPQDIGGKRGEVFFDDGRTLIRIAQNGDFSTVIHEIAHGLRREWLKLADKGVPEAVTIMGKLETALREQFGEDVDVLSKKADEWFAQLMEIYLLKGEAPTVALSDVFSKASRWMSRTYAKMGQVASTLELNQQFVDVFDAMVVAREAQEASARDLVLSERVLEDLTAEQRGLVQEQYDKLVAKEGRIKEKVVEAIHKDLLKLGRNEGLMKMAEANINALPIYELLAQVVGVGGFPVEALAGRGSDFTKKHGAGTIAKGDADLIGLRSVVEANGYSGDNAIDQALADAIQAPSRTAALEAEFDRLKALDTADLKSRAQEIADSLASQNFESLRDETLLLLMKIADIREARTPKSDDEYRARLLANRAIASQRIRAAQVSELDIKAAQKEVRRLEREVHRLDLKIKGANTAAPLREQLQKARESLAEARIKWNTKLANLAAQRVEIREKAQDRLNAVKDKLTNREKKKLAAARKKYEALQERTRAQKDKARAKELAKATKKADEELAELDYARSEAASDIQYAEFDADEASRVRLDAELELLRELRIVNDKYVKAFKRKVAAELRETNAEAKRVQRDQKIDERETNKLLRFIEQQIEDSDAAQARDDTTQQKRGDAKRAAEEKATANRVAAETRLQEKKLASAKGLESRELELNELLAERDRIKKQLELARVIESGVVKAAKALQSRVDSIVAASRRTRIPGKKHIARISAAAEGILRALSILTGMEDYGWGDKRKKALKNTFAARDAKNIRYDVKFSDWKDVSEDVRQRRIMEDYGPEVPELKIGARVTPKAEGVLNALADRPAGRLKRGEIAGVDQFLPAYNTTIPPWIKQILESGEAMPLSELTVAQANELLSVMEAINDLSADSMKDKRLAQWKDHSSAAQEGVEALKRLGERDEWDPTTLVGRAARATANAFGYLMSFNKMADVMGGPMTAFDAAFADADARHAMLVRDKTKAFWNEIAPVTKALRKRLKGKVLDKEHGFVSLPSDVQTIKGIPSWTVDQLLSVVLNLGNLGNRQALMGGKYQLTQEDIDKITSLFTSEELRRIINAGNVVGSLYDPFNETYSGIFGGSIPQVTGDPITLRARDGAVFSEGWYYPIKGDADIDIRVEKILNSQTTAERMLSTWAARFRFVPGAATARTGSEITPLLSVNNVVGVHIADIARFITHASTVYDVEKTLDAPLEIDGTTTYRKEITRSLGKDWTKRLEASIDKQANPRGGLVTGDRAAAWYRSWMTAVTLTFQATTGVKQRLSAIPAVNAMAQDLDVSPIEAAKHTFLAMADLGVGNVYTYGRIIEEISAESDYMKNRFLSFGDREVDDATRSATGNQGGRLSEAQENLRRFGYEWLRINDRATVSLVYLSTKRAAEAKGLSPQQAIEHAVSVVRKTQPSTNTADLSLAMQQPGFLRLMTWFMTYTMNASSRVSTALIKTRRGAMSKKQLAAQLVLETWVPSLVLLAAGELYAEVFGDDDDDDEEFDPWSLATAPVYQYLSGIPGAREISAGVKSGRPDFMLPAPLSIPWRKIRPAYYSLNSKRDYELARFAYDAGGILDLLSGTPVPSKMVQAFNHFLELGEQQKGE